MMGERGAIDGCVVGTYRSPQHLSAGCFPRGHASGIGSQYSNNNKRHGGWTKEHSTQSSPTKGAIFGNHRQKFVAAGSLG